MWLLFVWLVVAPDIDTRPDSRVGGPLYDLAQDVGRVGVTVAVSVAAYLVGAVSGEFARALRRISLLFPGGEIVMSVSGFPGPERPIRSEQVSARYEDAQRSLEVDQRRLPDDMAEHFRTELMERARQADIEALRELRLPATLLVGDQPQLFAEVDRLRAEGELRLAVVPPLAALTVLFAVLQTPLWLAGLLAVFLLYVQGLGRERDSRKVISDAISVGRIASPSVTKFEAWLDSRQKQIDQVARGEPSEYR